jgi:hypothetical protein
MINVPENNILAISFDPKWQSQEYIDMVFESLKGNQKRSWFVHHAYHCLPLVIGNQYGFVVKSLYDFEVVWDGGDSPASVRVDILTDEKEYEATHALQNINSHFGMGTFTVQMPYQLRTPEGINLMTTNPPNYFIDGIYHMTGVVEADNLRRDFTYNLRITRSNYKVKINKGDYIGCILPYPRHFIDKFQVNNITDSQQVLETQQVNEERKCMSDFAVERSTKDVNRPHRNGKRYWRGVDIYNNKFEDHQTGLDK